MRSSTTHKTTTGFTIAELLIAIAIVGVLAAIILSVFAGIRESGRRTTCQNNSRQIALGIQQYVQDNDGAYPLNISVEKKGENRIAVEWQELIYPYIKDAQLFHCPDQEQDSSDSSGLRYVDYTYNVRRLNNFTPPFPTNTIGATHESQVATPSSIWLTVDRGSITSDGVYHNSRLVAKTSCGRSFIGSTLHSGGGNYSFVDGHVKWLTPEAMGELECLNGPLPAPFKD